MTLTPAEAAAFAAIAQRIGDPEVRRDRRLLAFAAAVVLSIFTGFVMLGGWGWLPIAAFAATFLPGMALTSAILHWSTGSARERPSRRTVAD